MVEGYEVYGRDGQVLLDTPDFLECLSVLRERGTGAIYRKSDHALLAYRELPSKGARSRMRQGD